MRSYLAFGEVVNITTAATTTAVGARHSSKQGNVTRISLFARGERTFGIQICFLIQIVKTQHI